MVTRKSTLAKARADASKEFVTLAHAYDPAKHDVRGWLMSEKLDGIRFRLVDGKMLSRSQKPFPVPQQVIDLISEEVRGLPVDGELFAGRGIANFRKVSGWVRSSKTSVETYLEQIQPYVFDVVGLGSFGDRMAPLMAREGELDYVTVVPQECVRDADQVTARLEDVLKIGGEGLMLRNWAVPYYYGRSWDLLKVVKDERAEFDVIDHTAGEGKNEGVCGALVCITEAGNVFQVGSGLTDADRKSPPPVGARVTVEFKGWTGGAKSVPRCPRYIDLRTDQ
jgi:DNA ligase-1